MGRGSQRSRTGYKPSDNGAGAAAGSLACGREAGIQFEPGCAHAFRSGVMAIGEPGRRERGVPRALPGEPEPNVSLLPSRGVIRGEAPTLGVTFGVAGCELAGARCWLPSAGLGAGCLMRDRPA